MERPPPPLPRAVALTICLASAVALIGATIGKTEIIANAPGVVIPAGKAKIIQSPTTQAVDAVLVEDGQHVTAGQPLIRLDPISAYATRDKLSADLNASRLDVAGLAALSDQLHAPGQSLTFVPPDGVDPLRIEEERATIQARATDQQKKLANLKQQMAEKQAEVQEGENTMAKLKADLPMQAGVRDMYSRLFAQNLASRINLLNSRQRFMDTAHDLAIQTAHRDQATASFSALQHQYEGQEAAYEHEVLKDLTDARRKLAENEAAWRDAAHGVEETELKAPVSGTVQQLSIHSARGVAAAGDRLMVIVPDAQKLLVEAEIANRDIGFVKEGQSVQIKVSAFKFTRYGLVPGHIVSISRTSTADDLRTMETLNDPDMHHSNGKNGSAGSEEDLDGGEGSGYVARIALDTDRLTTEAGEMMLRPGMAVTAGIVTGKRRVISYIISPIERYAYDAGRER
ncbi:HlyD family type I secretion periplasmic adaptor subunit [Acetobacter sicerae]|uniref:Membrane fusion protein (MFP) family protein n=1 Tax=Acetobacter sicerae TaxID=85325 RepID=A0ABS8W2G3_9PROT|nr:HlyD family type I secretion periplasmic adaptor subunit [Acetobacter sicerae]MCE0745437.1 HlyD family type I secretion periplasmic adaptor subunit [Acetobacter sicerae]